MTLTETRLPLAHFVGRADENHRKLHTFCEKDIAKLLPKTARTAKMQATQRVTTATVTDPDLADTFAGGGRPDPEIVVRSHRAPSLDPPLCYLKNMR